MDRYSLLKDFDSRYLQLHQPSSDEVLLIKDMIDPRDVVLSEILSHQSLQEVHSGLYICPGIGDLPSQSIDGLNFQRQINRIFPMGSFKHRTMTQFREMRDYLWYLMLDHPLNLPSMEEVVDSWKSEPAKCFDNNALRFGYEYDLVYSGNGLAQIYPFCKLFNYRFDSSDPCRR